MTESKTSATLSGQNSPPKPQQAQDNQGKAAPQQVQRPKPGRKPLFRT
jgi:hypothetical protein